jgi:hypothetical protein
MHGGAKEAPDNNCSQKITTDINMAETFPYLSNKGFPLRMSAIMRVKNDGIKNTNPQ